MFVVKDKTKLLFPLVPGEGINHLLQLCPAQGAWNKLNENNLFYLLVIEIVPSKS